MRKERRIVVSIEINTTLPLVFLRVANNWDIRMFDGNSVVRPKVLQVQANVIRSRIRPKKVRC